MKNKKNSFPFSTVIAAVLFILVHFLFKITVFKSILLALAGFITSKISIKSIAKNKDTILIGGVSQKELDAALSAGYEKLHQIRKYDGLLYSTPIKPDLDSIEVSTTKILEEIKRDPPDLRKSNQFLTYYLDATVRILAKYVELRKHNNGDPEIAESVKKVEETFSTIRKAFDNQFTRLLGNEVSDLEVELSLLKNTLKMEGLCD